MAMEIDEFVNEAKGIHIIPRAQMRKIFESEENEGPKLAAVIVLTKEAFIKPETRDHLKKLWSENFNGKIEEVAETAPISLLTKIYKPLDDVTRITLPELLDWISSTK